MPKNGSGESDETSGGAKSLVERGTGTEVAPVGGDVTEVDCVSIRGRRLDTPASSPLSTWVTHFLLGHALLQGGVGPPDVRHVLPGGAGYYRRSCPLVLGCCR